MQVANFIISFMVLSTLQFFYACGEHVAHFEDESQLHAGGESNHNYPQLQENMMDKLAELWRIHHPGSVNIKSSEETVESSEETAGKQDDKSKEPTDFQRRQLQINAETRMHAEPAFHIDEESSSMDTQFNKKKEEKFLKLRKIQHPAQQKSIKKIPADDMKPVLPTISEDAYYTYGAAENRQREKPETPIFEKPQFNIDNKLANPAISCSNANFKSHAPTHEADSNIRGNTNLISPEIARQTNNGNLLSQAQKFPVLPKNDFDAKTSSLPNLVSPVIASQTTRDSLISYTQKFPVLSEYDAASNTQNRQNILSPEVDLQNSATEKSLPTDYATSNARPISISTVVSPEITDENLDIQQTPILPQNDADENTHSFTKLKSPVVALQKTNNNIQTLHKHDIKTNTIRPYPISLMVSPQTSDKNIFSNTPEFPVLPKNDVDTNTRNLTNVISSVVNPQTTNNLFSHIQKLPAVPRHDVASNRRTRPNLMSSAITSQITTRKSFYPMQIIPAVSTYHTKVAPETSNNYRTSSKQEFPSAPNNHVNSNIHSRPISMSTVVSSQTTDDNLFPDMQKKSVLPKYDVDSNTPNFANLMPSLVINLQTTTDNLFSDKPKFPIVPTHNVVQNTRSEPNLMPSEVTPDTNNNYFPTNIQKFPAIPNSNTPDRPNLLSPVIAPAKERNFFSNIKKFLTFPADNIASKTNTRLNPVSSVVPPQTHDEKLFPNIKKFPVVPKHDALNTRTDPNSMSSAAVPQIINDNLFTNKQTFPDVSKHDVTTNTRTQPNSMSSATTPQITNDNLFTNKQKFPVVTKHDALNTRTDPNSMSSDVTPQITNDNLFANKQAFPVVSKHYVATNTRTQPNSMSSATTPQITNDNLFANKQTFPVVSKHYVATNTRTQPNLSAPNIVPQTTNYIITDKSLVDAPQTSNENMFSDIQKFPVLPEHNVDANINSYPNLMSLNVAPTTTNNMQKFPAVSKLNTKSNLRNFPSFKSFKVASQTTTDNLLSHLRNFLAAPKLDIDLTRHNFPGRTSFKAVPQTTTDNLLSHLRKFLAAPKHDIGLTRHNFPGRKSFKAVPQTTTDNLLSKLRNFLAAPKLDIDLTRHNFPDKTSFKADPQTTNNGLYANLRKFLAEPKTGNSDRECSKKN